MLIIKLCVYIVFVSGAIIKICMCIYGGWCKTVSTHITLLFKIKQLFLFSIMMTSLFPVTEQLKDLRSNCHIHITALTQATLSITRNKHFIIILNHWQITNSSLMHSDLGIFLNNSVLFVHSVFFLTLTSHFLHPYWLIFVMWPVAVW